MNYTIIGAGFLGNYLHKNIINSKLITRADLNNIITYDHDIVVVVAPTGNRIQVNRDPDLDWINCQSIINVLSNCHYKKLIHVSTVDTYASLTSDSSLPSDSQPVARYGANRWLLEKTLKQLPNSQVLRLPSISDTTITKNILYDLKNRQWLDSINLESEVQWYVLTNLGQDIQFVVNSDIEYINMVSEPIQNYDIVHRYAPELLPQLSKNQTKQVKYNVCTSCNHYYVQTTHVWQSFDKLFIDTPIKYM